MKIIFFSSIIEHLLSVLGYGRLQNLNVNANLSQLAGLVPKAFLDLSPQIYWLSSSIDFCYLHLISACKKER